jgi:hypothetical protein
MTISVNAHRQAEFLMGEAEALVSSGQREAAGRRYREAALAEWEAFRHLPVDRQKTRGIIAVSSVSLYYRAGMLTTDTSIFRVASRQVCKLAGVWFASGHSFPAPIQPPATPGPGR